MIMPSTHLQNVHVDAQAMGIHGTVCLHCVNMQLVALVVQHAKVAAFVIMASDVTAAGCVLQPRSAQRFVNTVAFEKHAFHVAVPVHTCANTESVDTGARSVDVDVMISTSTNLYNSMAWSIDGDPHQGGAGLSFFFGRW